MAFFRVTMTTCDKGRPLNMIIEARAATLDALIDDINDPEFPWLVGTQHRTITVDGVMRWISNSCALAVHDICRITEIRSPFDKAEKAHDCAPLALVEDLERDAA